MDLCIVGVGQMVPEKGFCKGQRSEECFMSSLGWPGGGASHLVDTYNP